MEKFFKGQSFRPGDENFLKLQRPCIWSPYVKISTNTTAYWNITSPFHSTDKHFLPRYKCISL